MIDDLFNPYTYFETNDGLIAYTYGYHSQFDQDNMVCSIVSYFVDQPTDRLQVDTKRYLKKFIYEGNEVELIDHQKELPEKIYKQLQLYTKINRHSGEKLLVIPIKDAVKVYPSSRGLTRFLDNKKLLNESKRQIFIEMINLLKKNKIEQKDLGLYGSLQLGIVNKKVDADIDLLIFGLKNYNKLIKLTNSQSNQLQIDSKYQSINHFLPWKNARVTRNSIAKLHLPNGSDVDVKIIPEKNEYHNLNFHDIQIDDNALIEIEGKVINSQCGLSYPAVFEIQTSNKLYTVFSRMYVFIGAVKNGQFAKVKGKLIKNHMNYIIIADARNDYIYALDS